MPKYLKPKISSKKIKLNFFLTNITPLDRFHIIGDVYAGSGDCACGGGGGAPCDNCAGNSGCFSCDCECGRMDSSLSPGLSCTCGACSCKCACNSNPAFGNNCSSNSNCQRDCVGGCQCNSAGGNCNSGSGGGSGNSGSGSCNSGG